MIEEIGTVVELRGKKGAMVLCRKSTLCEHCASSGSCSIGDDDRSRVVEVFNPLGAKVGDQVRIVTSTRSFLQSSFMLYIMPLIALVIGAVVGMMVGELMMVDGLDPNLLSGIFGVFFMAGSFVLIRVGTRAVSQETYMPRIAEILPDVP